MGKASRKREQQTQKASPREIWSPGQQSPVYRMRMLCERFSWLPLIAIVLLTFAAYSSAIRGGFILDDDYYVTQNPLLTAPHGLWQIWNTTKSPQYYPLVFTTFWVEQRLWGLNPIGYHAVNVSLHAINAVIVFWLLRRLEVPGAWMIGAVFAVHPVHVESVAWITERKNVLSALFYLLSMGCYLRFESVQRWSWYVGALGLFILALLSKSVTATLPVALLLIRYLKEWRIGRREILELVPFLVIGAAMGLLTKWYETYLVGASGPAWSLSMGERLLLTGRTLSFYIMKLLWPINLSFNYPRWQLDIGDPMQWSWLLGIVLAGLLFWWKRSAWGRGPVVGLAFFSVSLAPASGFFNVYYTIYSFVADHFQYLASLGIIALIVGSVTWEFDQRIKSNACGKGLILKWIKPVLGLLVLVILAALTWKQGLIYRDPETLLQDTLKKNPNSWLVHNYLGTAYLRQGHLDDAIQEYLTALKLQPRYILAHNNLGATYLKQGRLEEAIQEYLAVLNLQPDDIDAHYNLAHVYSTQGRLEEAIQEYLAVLKLHPNDINARNNLGNIYSTQGHLEEAIQEYLTALKLQPDDINAHNNLGNIYATQGHLEKAIQEYLAVLKLQPDSILAHNNLGNVYSTQGCLEEAIQEYLTVLRLDPDNIVAHYNLGDVYKLKGLKDEARKQFEMALKLEPNFTPAQKDLESLNSQLKTHVK